MGVGDEYPERFEGRGYAPQHQILYFLVIPNLMAPQQWQFQRMPKTMYGC